MKSLFLLLFAVLASCSENSKSFSSVDEAKSKLQRIVESGDEGELKLYTDLSNVPNRVLTEIGTALKSCSCHIDKLKLVEVRVLDDEAYSAYCVEEHEKIPKAIRHLFNERPTWNRKPHQYLVYSYSNPDDASPGTNFDITFGLLREESRWRVATGYYPEKSNKSP